MVKRMVKVKRAGIYGKVESFLPPFHDPPRALFSLSLSFEASAEEKVYGSSLLLNFLSSDRNERKIPLDNNKTLTVKLTIRKETYTLFL